MPTLYIVSTPIGNLEDITLRALRVLREVGIIAAEDTRVTRKLLSHYDIHTQMTSFNEHNQAARIPELLSRLCEMDVALVSDAGTPGVNDPGQALVQAASDADISIAAVPGASALTSAVALSGIVTGGFIYLGFLPRKKRERIKLLQAIKHDDRPLVAFESPRRICQSLQDLSEILGERRIAVCREMTKLHEEVFRGTASEALERLKQPRGEFTLVIEGSAKAHHHDSDIHALASKLLEEMRREGTGAQRAVSHVTAITGLPRRKVYRMWLDSASSRSRQNTE